VIFHEMMKIVMDLLMNDVNVMIELHKHVVRRLVKERVIYEYRDVQMEYMEIA
jgi:hypothetical protein